MKRTAGTIMLLAGLGGCASPDGTPKPTSDAKPFGMAYKGVEAPGYTGASGEPVHLTRAARGAAPGGVTQAGGVVIPGSTGIQQTGGISKNGGGCANGECGPGDGYAGGGFGHHGGVVDPYANGPMGHGIGTLLGNNGIMPVPGMGPPGAVAAVGAIGPGVPYGPAACNQRTSIKFVNPQGMKVTWLGPTGYIDPGLTVPANYNFMQGNIYRLRLSGIPNRPGRVYYPTLEVAPVTPKTMTFLAHNTVPIAFTDDDFERVNTNNLVVKVIYLPDPMFQDLAAVAGAEEIVSAQLPPGEDPIIEATRRGTILAIIRIGNIDLENPFSPAMDAPPGGMMPRPAGPGMAVPGPMTGPAPGMTMPVPPGMPPGMPPAGMPPAGMPPAGNPAPPPATRSPATLPNAFKTSLYKN